jgi:hypothetical protein
MGRPLISAPPAKAADALQLEAETSVLDVLDRLLNKGVVAAGDLTLGVAGVDLIYVRLVALLGAADKVLPAPPADDGTVRRRTRKRSHRR